MFQGIAGMLGKIFHGNSMLFVIIYSGDQYQDIRFISWKMYQEHKELFIQIKFLKFLNEKFG